MYELVPVTRLAKGIYQNLKKGLLSQRKKIFTMNKVLEMCPC
jgi:hypothetical protein